MPILDQRLFPLIEILNKVDLNWLASELTAAISRTHEPFQDDDIDTRISEFTLSDYSEPFDDSPDDIAPTPQNPLTGDEQIKWAVQFLLERMNSKFEEISESLDALDEIVNSGEKLDEESDSRDLTAKKTGTLIFLYDEKMHSIDRTDLQDIKRNIDALTESLKNWLSSMGLDYEQ